MIEIENLQVVKNAAVICSVPKLSIGRAERICIIGRNGSGKSTLLRVLAGLENDFRGTCHIAAPRSQRVYVHQAPYLFRGTVLSNVRYGLQAHGIRGSKCEQQARHWLATMGIADLVDSQTEHLSGGERKRTALARALAIEPRIALLDEPFAELDKEGIATVVHLLADLQDTTVILTSPTQLTEDLAMKSHCLAVR